jgi:hypothetical protein
VSLNLNYIHVNFFSHLPGDDAGKVVFENGTTYPLMTILEIDTVVNKSNAVYKLYIAKNAGIVGFETYPANQKWIIQ